MQDRQRNRLVLISAVALMLAGSVQPAVSSAAADANDYVRIEEDWVLTVTDPNEDKASPQVLTGMSPGDDNFFCAFQINHRELSTFVLGGMQVQMWQSGLNCGFRSYGSAAMRTMNETVTWTQYMERDGTSLKFGIKDGESATWGSLKDAQLHLNSGNASQFFDNYSTSFSVQKSGITFGANRVQVLKLVQVRKYKADNSFDTDSTERIVYQQIAP